MDQYRCKKENANFIGMYPLGVFRCEKENLGHLFRICVKNNYSILEKPDKNCQKLILDLDEKEKEIDKEIISEIIKEVENVFEKEFFYVICKREGSFGVHLHFLGVLVSDEIYKDLTKYLKKKFPIVDTSPFNHFIPGTGKTGKSPYLPVDGYFHLWKNYCTKKKFLLTKNLTGREIGWEFFTLKKDIKEKQKEPKKIVFNRQNQSADKLDQIISFCEEILKTDPDCVVWNDYCNWVKVGFVLAHFEREDLWHRFSSLSEKYDESDCEKKWDELSSTARYGNPKIIINMLKKEGYEFDPPPILNRKELIRNA